MDLVKLDEPNKNSMQVQEKASKLWNDMKGSPSDYQELIVKLEKECLLKSQEMLQFEKALSRKHKNYNQQKSW